MSEKKNTGVIKVSTASGNNKKGGQTYQNFFGFKHQGKSKKTEKIIATPLDRLCQRCYDCLQWKIDYRKYKPLSKSHKCNKCHQPKIIKAYRTVCDGCASKDNNNGCKICTKCSCPVIGPYANPRTLSKADLAQQEDRQKVVQDALASLKLNSRRKVERLIQKEEIFYSHAKKTFVYSEDPEKQFEVKNRDDDEYGDEDNSDEDAEETKLENVDEELDAIDNENIQSKIAEVVPQTPKIEEESKETSEPGPKIAKCHKQHVLKAKMSLPDCYIGKFDCEQNYLHCDNDSCKNPIDFNNVWFHHCKTCQSDFCQRCKGQIIKTEADALHQASDCDDSENDEMAEQKQEEGKEQIQEQKN